MNINHCRGRLIAPTAKLSAGEHGTATSAVDAIKRPLQPGLGRYQLRPYSKEVRGAINCAPTAKKQYYFANADV